MGKYLSTEIPSWCFGDAFILLTGKKECWNNCKTTMLLTSHDKVLYPLFCPDLNKMFLFTYLRLEKEWRYKVQCKHQSCFLHLAFETFLLCLWWSSLPDWLVKNQNETLFSPFSSAILCVLIWKYRYEKEMSNQCRPLLQRTCSSLVVWANLPIKVSFGEQDVDGQNDQLSGPAPIF